MQHIRGRFLSCDAEGVLLWSQGQYRSIQGKTFVFEGEEKSTFEISHILHEGDLIEIEQHNLRRLVRSFRPWSPPKVSVETLNKWTLFHQDVREFFVSQGFLEVLTPHLVLCPGSEPSLDVFQIENTPYFLPTSPEWHLKKALVMGFENIFEIKNCFRKNESTEKHRPEFLMLEWYRSFEKLEKIQRDVVELIHFCCQKSLQPPPQSVEVWTIQELFKKYLNFDFTPQTSEAELRRLAGDHQVDVRSATSIDDVFFLLFGERIENQFDREKLLFVKNYPPYQAALAQISEEGWGERFEAYWKGFELCNAFQELNDPKIQRQRFAEDQAKKVLMGKSPVGVDEDFFEALERGLPPSSGIALGLERLFMALYQMNDFKHLRLF